MGNNWKIYLVHKIIVQIFKLKEKIAKLFK
jgi:hypothetical protein